MNFRFYSLHDFRSGKVCLGILLILLTSGSCVQLPNLVPNGSGEPDMAVYELNLPFPDYAQTLTVDEQLTFTFLDDVFFNYCGAQLLKVTNGQVLAPSALNAAELYSGLSADEVVGGWAPGQWSPYYIVTASTDWYTFCLYQHYIVADRDVVMGLRFRMDGAWHYGWIVLYLDTVTGPSNKLYIKRVGYNLQAGMNVRIPG